MEDEEAARSLTGGGSATPLTHSKPRTTSSLTSSVLRSGSGRVLASGNSNNNSKSSQRLSSIQKNNTSFMSHEVGHATTLALDMDNMDIDDDDNAADAEIDMHDDADTNKKNSIISKVSQSKSSRGRTFQSKQSPRQHQTSTNKSSRRKKKRDREEEDDEEDDNNDDDEEGIELDEEEELALAALSVRK
jgi:hypothetical protein